MEIDTLLCYDSKPYFITSLRGSPYLSIAKTQMYCTYKQGQLMRNQTCAKRYKLDGVVSAKIDKYLHERISGIYF